MHPIGTTSFLIALLLSAHVQSAFNDIYHDNREESILPRAIVQVIRNVHRRELSTLHFMQQDAKLDDILSEVVNHTHASFAYTVETFGHITGWFRRWFSVVLISNENEFEMFVRKLNGFHFDPQGFYIIAVKTVLNAAARENLSKTIFKSFFGRFHDNVLTLFRDEQGSIVYMYTFYPCDAAHSCYEVVPVLHNTFDGKKFARSVWNFPKKWTNFNGCPVSVALCDFPPHVVFTKTDEGEVRVHGLDVSILEMIASHLNFTTDCKVSKRGQLYSNGTATDMFGLLMSGKADLMIGGFSPSNDQIRYISASRYYLQTEFVFALPVSLEVGNLKRLLFPFKKEIWIAYISVHCIAFIFLTILKRFGSRFYQFIVGDHSRSPFFEMFQVCYGVSLRRTPRYTFARSLFAIWLLSTFVLSTSYRGRLIEILTSRSPKSIPLTLDEFDAMEYEIYVRPQLEDYMQFLYGNDSRIQVKDSVWNYFLEFQTPSGRRRAIMDSHIIVSYFNALNYRNGVLPIMPDRLQHVYMNIFFKKNSYLVPAFDRVLEHFSGSGLIDKWTRDILNISSTSSRQGTSTGPTRISVDHFKGALHLNALVLTIALLLFLIELISLRCRVLRRIIQFYTE